MATLLIPLPNTDFDPTEVAVPWRILQARGHRIVFATPDGGPANADPIMVSGRGLGLLAGLLRADANGREAYGALQADASFQRPLPYAALQAADYAGIILPGGHAQGVRPYLESASLQALVAAMFALDRPVGAICHGTIVAARSRDAQGRSVLFGRRTTALTAQMELSAWWLTRAWMGDYYRTYPETVQSEVTRALARAKDFDAGPISLRRDTPDHPELGFVVRDGNYLSARWPGDAHRFAAEFAAMLG
ncbi:type 1 glutamine amidotransferase domain-containing protein [Paucibacter sp. R3-3]|uniref:Type 1 glutamine amidotransferase domain-containing protein n=1 Tax=Roseateles agri TaxID=3098619 RepID=A0ABU5DNW3_9BURK|nr:type 1 glutamine amidotransferase domain-containing protein [Paucibacter sp. R3-3]MDY0748001.1 type 1 glutamine amidotransferase domain-containing protein [Paucibacter sp. R3-3]